MSVRVKAYAKLNLTLSITGSSGGYHMLDSLVCSVDLFDLIVLKKRKDDKVIIQMHGQGTELLPYDENNAARAAESYINTFGTCGADITIYKNIPLGAGLGGSSADAAGVLIGMTKLYGAGSERELKELAASLGSDTGYMLTGGYARLLGRGDKVEYIDSKLKLDFLLLKPNGGVSTAECYKLYDSMPQAAIGSESAIHALISGDRATLGACLNNALYAPAAILNPEVKTAYEELEAFSPLGVCMTGSGSAVFALFENAEFCRWAQSRYKGKFKCIQLKTI
ncbi:MAG: 4-(cytidine 5'-diphospho)-2-C-methyl-D-erythritol kinase [Clostridiales bacterium]|nr:4-(cytidine 5'-diphospho)-2-C-methyl-D-erythritol kinase [Clostridiales bacterium]